MLEHRTAVFVVNLLQDVNVLRPLIFMARQFGFRVLILAPAKFATRDQFGIWHAELECLSDETGAQLEIYGSDWEAFRHLTGAGVIFAGSESNLPPHGATHSLFRYAPPTFLKVTLQHGFECVGFRHSKAHDTAYGQAVSFAADILCAWQPPELLSSMARSQRAKVHVTGPSNVLQAFTQPIERDPRSIGIVCENLHSVRLNVGGDHKTEFVTTFDEYCRLLAREGREVVLRTHPGGQYVLKNKVPLPSNARINNAPIYRLDLRRFSYGISAPSSVLVDLLLAGVPTAVWRDRRGQIDADNYTGLASVSTPQEWLEFAREAALRPQPFLDVQQQFLAEQKMPLEPQEVFDRFARIFRAASRVAVAPASIAVPSQRLLFVANARLPTLQVCLERPLDPLARAGTLAMDLVTEPQLKQVARSGPAGAIDQWIDATFGRFAPDALIFCRYSGPFAPQMLSWAQGNGIPVIYHIDDDLLAVPKELGERKHAFHNAPNRLAAVRTLLSGADVVYASTERLRQRLLDYYPDRPMVTGPINCSGRILGSPGEGFARTIGYTGFDHFADLMMILPALIAILDKYSHISFEVFGSIPIPQELERFGNRVRTIPPVQDYEAFLQRLAELKWDIGICPLTQTEFNLTKSNNKWVEYTSVGTAVIASGNMIYDECCADGSGILAYKLDDWAVGLDLLVNDDAARLAMVARAQRKLEADYGIAKHRKQILGVVELARELAERRAVTELIVEEVG